ncbi:DUF5097 domain-containing protein [Encephalitozoon intestinalis]|nr:DUF5097 domain-containing protein [Encephalitozoon intestinalis]
MIESPAIKKFIVNYFIEHSQENIDDIAARIDGCLRKRFVENEVVSVVRSGEWGRISRVAGDRYVVSILSLDGGREERLHFSELARKDMAGRTEVKGYLLGITMETPFGRVLKENAFRSIRDSGEVMKCKVPQSQCYEGSFVSRRGVGGTERRKWKTEKEGQGSREKNEERETEGSRAKRASVRKEGTKETSVSSILLVGPSQALEIPGLRKEDIELVMKIFGVVANFGGFFGIQEIDVLSLGRAIVDPWYEDDTICKIHLKLISGLRTEMDSVGMEEFVENSKACIEWAKEQGREEDLAGDGGEMEECLEQSLGCGEEGWKKDLRKLIESICDDGDTDIFGIVRSISGRSRALGRGEIRKRLVVIELLMNMFFTTEQFREIIWEKMEESKDLEKKKRELQTRLKRSVGWDGESKEAGEGSRAEMEKELGDTREKIFQLPVNTGVGNVDGVGLLHLGRKIYAAWEGDYYLVGRDRLADLCKKYKAKNKEERHVLESIGQNIEGLKGHL